MDYDTFSEMYLFYRKIKRAYTYWQQEHSLKAKETDTTCILYVA